MQQVCAVSKRFCELASSPLSWENASVFVSTDDLKILTSGQSFYQVLLPRWRHCDEAMLDFQDVHKMGAQKRLLAEKCLRALAQCESISRLCVRNWLTAERSALGLIAENFPSLRHLELSGCDLISNYEAVLPIFNKHTSLLSLRCSFKARASAGLSFAEAAPKCLKALGFVRFDSPEVLSTLLQRCALEHLWLSATSGAFTKAFARAICRSPRAAHLSTLAFPSESSNERCLEVMRSCPRLSLVCRMRIAEPFDGEDFEPLPGSNGVVLRRRGSAAELAENSSLWTPFAAPVSFPLGKVPPAAPEALETRVTTSEAWKVPKVLAIAASTFPLKDKAILADLAAAAARRRAGLGRARPEWNRL